MGPDFASVVIEEDIQADIDASLRVAVDVEVCSGSGLERPDARPRAPQSCVAEHPLNESHGPVRYHEYYCLFRRVYASLVTPICTTEAAITTTYI